MHISALVTLNKTAKQGWCAKVVSDLRKMVERNSTSNYRAKLLTRANSIWAVLHRFQRSEPDFVQHSTIYRCSRSEMRRHSANIVSQKHLSVLLLPTERRAETRDAPEE